MESDQNFSWKKQKRTRSAGWLLA